MCKTLIYHGYINRAFTVILPKFYDFMIIIAQILKTKFCSKRDSFGTKTKYICDTALILLVLIDDA